MNITLANADSNSPLLLVVKLCGILVTMSSETASFLQQRLLDGVEGHDYNGVVKRELALRH